MKLTDTFVRKVKLKKGNKEDWFSDGRGTNFYLHVRDVEQKDWFSLEVCLVIRSFSVV